MEQGNLSALDLLAVISIALQINGVRNDLKQASNDDLLAELQKQDKVYLEQIIGNQKLILEKLATLG